LNLNSKGEEIPFIDLGFALKIVDHMGIKSVVCMKLYRTAVLIRHLRQAVVKKDIKAARNYLQEVKELKTLDIFDDSAISEVDSIFHLVSCLECRVNIIHTLSMGNLNQSTEGYAMSVKFRLVKILRQAKLMELIDDFTMKIIDVATVSVELIDAIFQGTLHKIRSGISSLRALFPGGMDSKHQDFDPFASLKLADPNEIDGARCYLRELAVIADDYCTRGGVLALSSVAMSSPPRRHATSRLGINTFDGTPSAADGKLGDKNKISKSDKAIHRRKLWEQLRPQVLKVASSSSDSMDSSGPGDMLRRPLSTKDENEEVAIGNFAKMTADALQVNGSYKNLMQSF
jgi:hypothetical protein